MRFYLIIVTIFYIINSSIGQQTYIPYAQSDKFWFYNVYDGSENIYKCTGTYVLWTKGDTTISENNYKKIHKSFLKGRHICPTPPCFAPDLPYVIKDTTLLGYLRDDEVQQIVYFLPAATPFQTCGQEEQELYNFNLNVGDTMSNCFMNRLGMDTPLGDYGRIDSIAYLNLYGKERKVFYLEMPINKGLLFLQTTRLIEGVGMDFYDAVHYNYEHNFNDFCEGSLFQCHITSSTNKPEKSYVQLLPNPSTGLFKIGTSDVFIKASITDIAGRIHKISVLDSEINISEFQPGIYFVELTDSQNNLYYSKIIKL